MAQQEQQYHYLIVKDMIEDVYRDGDVVCHFRRFKRDINPIGYVIVENGKLVLRGFGEDRIVKNVPEACDIAEPLIFEMKSAYLSELHEKLSPRGRIAPPDHIYYNAILDEVQATFDYMEEKRRWQAGEPDPIDDEWYAEHSD